MDSLRFLLTLTLSLCAAGLARADAPRYTAVDLGPAGGAGDGHAGKVSAAGDVAAVAFLGDGAGQAPHALLFSAAGGGVTDLNAGRGPGYAYDVNRSGTAVGASGGGGDGGDGPARATRWTSAGVGLLPSPGDSGAAFLLSEARAINDSGLIVGMSETSPGGPFRAVSWTDGAVTALPTLGGAVSRALDVNSAGVIVGDSETSPGSGPRAAVWRDGVVTNLGTLGGTHGSARAVNDAGWIVGVSRLADDVTIRATLWRDGAVTDLGVPEGGLSSVACGVSAAGDVLGVYTPASGGGLLPFLYSDGVMYDFRTLLVPESPVRDFTVNAAFGGMNEAGQFAATAVVDGRTHFFLLTPAPVPEPAAAGLALWGAARVLLRRRRERPLRETFPAL